MKIYCTGSQLNEMGLWERYCDITGTNLYAMNEGQMDSAESVVVPEEMWEAVAIRIVSSTNNRNTDENV